MLIQDSTPSSKKSSLKNKTGQKECQEITRVNKFKLQLNKGTDEQMSVRFADEELTDNRNVNTSLEKPRGGPGSYHDSSQST